jgi:hypothetical protein
MNKILLGILVIFTFTTSIYANRERALQCPEYDKKSNLPLTSGKLSLPGSDSEWDIMLGGFSYAYLSQEPRIPAALFCVYGETRIFMAIPPEYKGSTCSFDRDQYTRKCELKNPKDCVVYCEKR